MCVYKVINDTTMYTYVYTYTTLRYVWSFLVAQIVKNLPAMQETRVDPLVGKIPWRRQWQSSPIFLPGEFHGQRSLAGYSPWGHKESDATERLTHSATKAAGKTCQEVAPAWADSKQEAEVLSCASSRSSLLLQSPGSDHENRPEGK